MIQLQSMRNDRIIIKVQYFVRAILLSFIVAQYVFAKEMHLRFVTTKFSEVNVRTGPGYRYPVESIFIRSGEPLAIIAEFELWRYVKDIKGKVGWVHSSVLSSKRSVVILGDDVKKDIKILFKNPHINAKMLAKLEPGLRCQLKECDKNDWCKIKCADYVGWIQNVNLWGIR